MSKTLHEGSEPFADLALQGGATSLYGLLSCLLFALAENLLKLRLDASLER
jgi:hypothetical protein